MKSFHFSISAFFLFGMLFLSNDSYAACDKTFWTSSDIVSAIAQAAAGTVICLNDGDYGTLQITDVSKSGKGVTVQSASWKKASVYLNVGNSQSLAFRNLTISGLEIDTSQHWGSRNITVADSIFTGQAVIDVGSAGNANILIDGNTFDAINACENCHEWRLEILGGGNSAGVTVTNNHFWKAGESDGIQIGAYGVVVGPGNVFDGIIQGNYQRHVDAIQGYGQSHTVIVGNYFKNNDVDIMMPDGWDSERITDNVFDRNDPWPAIQLGSHVGTVFSNNTVRNVEVLINRKVENSVSSNVVARDNILIDSAGLGTTDWNGANACANCSIGPNIFTSKEEAGATDIVGVPIFFGGKTPKTWGGWKLLSSSPGYKWAANGKDMGTNYFGPTNMVADTSGVLESSKISATSISEKYPKDAKIGDDPDVLYSLDFDSDESVSLIKAKKKASDHIEIVRSDPTGKFEAFSWAALKVTIPKWSNEGVAINLYLKDIKGSGEPTEAYMRYYLRFGDNWKPVVDGGKLPGFAGTYNKAWWGGRKPNGTDGWSIRAEFVKWDAPGVPSFWTLLASYAYYADQPGYYGDIWDWGTYVPNNEWHAVEQHVKMNTPGKHDGILEVWVDGEKALEKKDIMMRTVDTLKIESAWLDVYHGGTAKSQQDQSLYLDNIVVAKSYIWPVSWIPQVGSPIPVWTSWWSTNSWAHVPTGSWNPVTNTGSVVPWTGNTWNPWGTSTGTVIPSAPSGGSSGWGGWGGGVWSVPRSGSGGAVSQGVPSKPVSNVPVPVYTKLPRRELRKPVGYQSAWNDKNGSILSNLESIGGTEPYSSYSFSGNASVPVTVSFDITEMLKSEMESGSKELDILMRSEDGKMAVFVSREFSNRVFRPVLIVEFSDGSNAYVMPFSDSEVNPKERKTLKKLMRLAPSNGILLGFPVPDELVHDKVSRVMLQVTSTKRFAPQSFGIYPASIAE